MQIATIPEPGGKSLINRGDKIYFNLSPTPPFRINYIYHES